MAKKAKVVCPDCGSVLEIFLDDKGKVKMKWKKKSDVTPPDVPDDKSLLEKVLDGFGFEDDEGGE